jgi:tetratricopeptide (TPR) repeat protein
MPSALRFLLALGAVPVAALGLLGCGHGAAAAGAQTPASAAAASTASARVPFVSPFAYEWFVRAELLEARGEHAQAAEAYRNALSSADEDPYLYARLAQALQGAGDIHGADRALQAGLALDPRSEPIWLARARITRHRGPPDQAFEAYERAEAAAPSSAEAPLELAELLRAQGHAERALAVLERFAARTKAGSRAALRARLELARARGDGAALAEAARAWLEHGSTQAELVRRTASELFEAGRPALALRVLSVLPPEDRDARLRLSVALALERHEEAELLLASTPPEALGGPLEIAEAYLRIGRAERALASLDEADASDAADPHHRALLTGLSLLALGRPADAAEQLARVPVGSAHRARAVHGIAQALQAAGLDALGHEVEQAR